MEYPLKTVPEEEEEEGEAPLAQSSALVYDSDCSFYADSAASSVRPYVPSQETSIENNRLPYINPYVSPYASHDEQPQFFRPSDYHYPTRQRGQGLPSNRTSKWQNNRSPHPPSITNGAALPLPVNINLINPAFRQEDANHNQIDSPTGYPCSQYYLPNGQGQMPVGRAPSVASLPYGMDSQTLDDSSITAHEKTYIYKEPPILTDIEEKTSSGNDDNEARGNWSGRFDFILSCVGMAVGLGNVWRFPYLCYKNGGGAFFIPYFIMLIFVGIPLFLLETSLGQFSSNGPFTCWKFAPIFKGLGLAQVVANTLVSIYYNVVMAWSLFYLVASFTSHLPWSDCFNTWNSEGCYYKIPDVVCDELQGFIKQNNGTCTNSTGVVGVWNYTVFHSITGVKRVLPSEDYFSKRVLGLSAGIDVTGPVRWELALALLSAWCFTFFCTFKGIKTSGKVVYFTALFPYLMLLILLIRGAILPNAGQGVKYFLTPQWHRLGDARVWYDAVAQVFFSVGLSYGSIIALSSYNKFNSNCVRNTLIVTIANIATSIFAGLALFCYLGYMASEFQAGISNVVTGGPGLVFVVYSHAVTHFPGSQFWSFASFIMVLTLGLNSQFAALEMIVTCIVDQLPSWRPHRVKVNLSVHVVLFLLGLPLCTTSGMYWFQLMDIYCGGWGLMIIGLLECVSLGWVYGSVRFFEDIHIMVGKKPNVWWRFCWQISAPLLLTFIIIFSWIDYSGATYGDDYVFPFWANALGWLMSICSVIWIPVVAIYKIFREEEGSLSERVKYLGLPTKEWGPALLQHRRLVTYVEGFIVDPWEKNPTSHKNNEKGGFENWGMPYALSASNDTLSTISIFDQRWQQQRQTGPIMSSMGSIEYLNNGSNMGSHLGSQMSIGAISTVSFESGV